MNQRGFTLPIIALVLVVIAMVGYLTYQKLNKPLEIEDSPFITTFDECIKSSGSKVTESFPKYCEGSDKKTYIEEVKEPIDTSSWKEVKTTVGFSFKCPPMWSCGMNDEADIARGGFVAQADIQNYIRYSLGFGIIRAENFQQSGYRNQNYKNGVDWFNGLLAKDPKALDVVPGKYIKQEIKVDNKKALVIDDYDKVLVPLDSQNLLFIDRGLGTLSNKFNDRRTNSNLPSTIGNAIILSIKFNTLPIGK